MPTFGSKKFRTSSYNNTLPARYRAALAKHPFALFGLPFVGTMLLGSFFLTPATAPRPESENDDGGREARDWERQAQD
jgi:cytochrome c oxidase assembly protein subunit 16